MAVEERDPHTGYLTTGHEWNGIKELNTPLPKVVTLALVLTFLFALGYWLLMPAWPTGKSYTRGLLGFDQRAAVAEELRQATASRAAWARRIETLEFAAIQADPALMSVVREAGRTLFGDNCAACHGVTGTGGPGYPSLAAKTWLWGGTPEAIAEALRVGINAAHPETRVAQMPAFGRDNLLPREDIRTMVAYVRSLSGAAGANAIAPEAIAAGQSLFASNCAACHGEDAKGNSAMGAPDLTDQVWIYGGDDQSLATTLSGGRQGHMPTWEARLGSVDRKILALYVLELGRPRP